MAVYVPCSAGSCALRCSATDIDTVTARPRFLLVYGAAANATTTTIFGIIHCVFLVAYVACRMVPRHFISNLVLPRPPLLLLLPALPVVQCLDGKHGLRVDLEPSTVPPYEII